MEKPVPGPKSQYATILRGLPFLNILPSYSQIEHSMSKILGKYNITLIIILSLSFIGLTLCKAFCSKCHT